MEKLKEEFREEFEDELENEVEDKLKENTIEVTEKEFEENNETEVREEETVYDLSDEQQKKIRNELTEIFGTLGNNKVKINENIREDIRLAVHSGVKELYDIGCLVAYAAIKPYCISLAVKFQDPPRTMVEDLINTPLFETVRDNIKRYNAKYALITFFEKYVISAFIRAKEEGRGNVMTKYYIDTTVIIKRARIELENLNITDVSDADLSQWIKTKYKKTISPVTIRKIDEMSKEVSSIDASVMQIADSEMADPASIFAEKERQEEFRKGIRALSSRHGKFIQAALNYTRETGAAPETPAQAYEICKTFMPNVSKEQAARLMRSAFREFGRFHRRYRQDEKPINGMRMIGDIEIMEEEENEIQNAIGNGTEFFNNENFEDEVLLDEGDIFFEDGE